MSIGQIFGHTVACLKRLSQKRDGGDLDPPAMSRSTFILQSHSNRSKSAKLHKAIPSVRIESHAAAACRSRFDIAKPVQNVPIAGLKQERSVGMGGFEKYLSVWIALAMVAGIVMGNVAPALVEAIAAAEFASVNLVVAVLIWAMVYPMMVGVDPGSLRDVARQPRGLLITLVVNWLIKPFTMAALAVVFFQHVFAPWIQPEDAMQYIAGLILLGAAPCTAMVFVWSQLTHGDETYTLLQVSVNDLIMVIAFAPIVAFLLGVTDISVPWETLVLSVLLFIALPLVAGMLTRRRLGDATAIEAFQARVKPYSVVGLITTVMILFALQGQVIVSKPFVIVLIAVPIILQSYGVFAIAYAAAYALKVPHRIAAPCALIGTSNFFELAVAVAISLFGLNSGAALATVVGVLVEVPVMLTLVAFANRTRARFAA